MLFVVLSCVLAADGDAALDSLKVVPSGYLETYIQWNFNQPTNGVTDYRAFDNRHDTFTLQNAVLALDAHWSSAYARVALQVGSTGDTYYAAEADQPGGGGSSSSNPAAFRHIQEAYAGFALPFASALTVDAGLFMSPLGVESMAVKETWLWSRSNLFFGLPFYHTGARLAWQVTPDTRLRFAVYNGWNSVVDNNNEKSFSLQLSTKLSDRVTFDAQYFAGVERPRRAPEGRAFRQLIDTWIAAQFTPWLEGTLYVDLGIEPNHFGTSRWQAAAAFLRAKLRPWLFVAGRMDAFFEQRARNANGEASAIFFPAPWVSSPTFAVDVRPLERISVRLEYRYDMAGRAIYFDENAPSIDGVYAANKRAQSTVTLGLTAWF